MDASRGTQKVLNSLLTHQCDVLQACQRGRNTYLAGGLEVTTFTNVDTTVTAGSVDTNITVEVTWEGASSAKGHTILASGLVGSRSRYEGVRGNKSTVSDRTRPPDRDSHVFLMYVLVK